MIYRKCPILIKEKAMLLVRGSIFKRILRVVPQRLQYKYTLFSKKKRMLCHMVVLFCFVCCLFCFVLFCFVLFCFVLFLFVLFVLFCFCFVLFCFVLFLFCFVLFCFVCFVLFWLHLHLNRK